MSWLIEYLTPLIVGKFTGNIQINFFMGGVTNVVKTESIKPPS